MLLLLLYLLFCLIFYLLVIIIITLSTTNNNHSYNYNTKKYYLFNMLFIRIVFILFKLPYKQTQLTSSNHILNNAINKIIQEILYKN